MAFDPDAYLSGGTATDTFDPDAYLASSPTPSPTPEDGGGETLSDRVKKFLFSPEGAQTTRNAIQGAVESVPQMALDTAKMGYKGLRLATGDPQERAQIIEEALAQAKAQGEQTSHDIQSPFGTPEFLRGAGQLGMMALPGLEAFRELGAPSEVPPVEPPPIQTEAPPPEMPVQSTPLPPEAFAPPAPQVPPPPIGTPLNGVPLVGPAGQTAADVAAAQTQPQLPVSQEGAPPLIQPGDEAYAGVTSQTGTTEPVGGNVAGFEKVYGPGEVPAGPTLTPEDAWDAAHARSQSGKAQPYGFVDRARSGAITPEEMGDLIYEHHRLVERAAGMEGTPQYGEAYQAALDFANNVLKPAETAWHQKGMTMQIARPVDLSNMTGMDTLMRQELNRGIKPGEASKFKGMANDIKNGESEVQKAVGRADAKVQRRYAKVPDIPIEEAVARVKQMLKDCM